MLDLWICPGTDEFILWLKFTKEDVSVSRPRYRVLRAVDYSLRLVYLDLISRYNS